MLFSQHYLIHSNQIGPVQKENTRFRNWSPLHPAVIQQLRRMQIASWGLDQSTLASNSRGREGDSLKLIIEESAGIRQLSI